MLLIAVTSPYGKMQSGENQKGKVENMMNTITTESMELLLEEIVDAVEMTDDRDLQFELVKAVLEEQGIVSIKD